MRRLRLAHAIGVGALAVAACNPFGARGTPFGHTSVHHVERARGSADARWAASLGAVDAAPGAQGQTGSATMSGGFDDRNTYVSVDLRRGAPGDVHPWQLRRGQCGADGGAFGAAEAYQPMTVDAEGRAASSVTVPLVTPTGGRYYVTVAESAARPGVPIACGNLALATP